VAQKGEIQRWMIFNLTGDTHPMHFHLVNVVVRKREAWKFNPATGDPIQPLQAIPGTARQADPNEQGWKETVRMNPGEVVTVDMKFDLPKGTQPPPSQRLLTNYGIRGAEYVWHCHILEHEEHDMMRPLVVTE
jgi:spore coat protein A